MFQIWQHYRGTQTFDVKTVEEIEAIIRAGDHVKWYIEYISDTVGFGEELHGWGTGSIEGHATYWSLQPTDRARSTTSVLAL
jgi:hypothetical protein